MIVEGRVQDVPCCNIATLIEDRDAYREKAVVLRDVFMRYHFFGQHTGMYLLIDSPVDVDTYALSPRLQLLSRLEVLLDEHDSASVCYEGSTSAESFEALL